MPRREQAWQGVRMVAGSAPEERAGSADDEGAADPDATSAPNAPSGAAAPPSVAVIDGQRTFAELLSHALGTEPGITCVGMAVDAETGWALIESEQPQVVVMDVDLGDDDGLALTERITEVYPAVRVV